MFTGIISDIGTVLQVETQDDTRVVIGTSYDTAGIAMGASIACSGVCLTVVETAPGRFSVDVSGETLSRTAHGQWSVGRRLNLERALRMGDELGGHIVTGHVDGLGEVTAVTPDGGSHRVDVRVTAEVAPFIAAKGSITLDGVSLTVNTITDQADGSAIFGINIIPHTWAVTALGDLVPGAAVNLEIDVLARYLSRMRERLDSTV